MSTVFADAFYFVARLNRRDQHHERVVAFSREHRDFILHLRQAAGCEVVPASREWQDRALDLYHQPADKQWTLTDCVSFVVMRERLISEALTQDHHFEQAGFITLLK